MGKLTIVYRTRALIGMAFISYFYNNIKYSCPCTTLDWAESYGHVSQGVSLPCSGYEQGFSPYWSPQAQ